MADAGEVVAPSDHDDPLRDLERATGLSLRRGAMGRDLTTYSIGGMLHRFVEVQTLKELSSVVGFISSRGERYLVLGGGSNLLIPDCGVSDWVIKLGRG